MKKSIGNSTEVCIGCQEKHVRVLTVRLMVETEVKVCEEQGGIRKGKGCVNQTFKKYCRQ